MNIFKIHKHIYPGGLLVEDILVYQTVHVSIVSVYSVFYHNRQYSDDVQVLGYPFGFVLSDVCLIHNLSISMGNM